MKKVMLAAVATLAVVMGVVAAEISTKQLPQPAQEFIK